MNKVYLLDTNIVSEFSKFNPNPNVVAFYESRKNLCAISSITWQELVYGMSKMPEGKRKDYVRACLHEYKDTFEIIPYDSFASEICGKALASYEQKGKPLPFSDTQIAATAISNGMVLVTHNTDDFKELSDNAFLRLEDWFTA